MNMQEAELIKILSISMICLFLAGTLFIMRFRLNKKKAPTPPKKDEFELLVDRCSKNLEDNIIYSADYEHGIYLTKKLFEVARKKKEVIHVVMPNSDYFTLNKFEDCITDEIPYIEIWFKSVGKDFIKSDFYKKVHEIGGNIFVFPKVKFPSYHVLVGNNRYRYSKENGVWVNNFSGLTSWRFLKACTAPYKSNYKWKLI